jgi:hypothetical protein
MLLTSRWLAVCDIIESAAPFGLYENRYHHHHPPKKLLHPAKKVEKAASKKAGAKPKKATKAAPFPVPQGRKPPPLSP